MTKKGVVLTNRYQQTNIEGLYVAGDASKDMHFVVVAAAEGAKAGVLINKELQKEIYPFSALAEKGANTLIFPNLASGNIAYKLLMEIGGAEAIGPILLGMKKTVHVLQLGSSIREIVNMAAIAVVDAQIHEKNGHL